MYKKCQVFTPDKIVVEVLNEVGYTSFLHGKKILENSCGDGQFLIEIVKRYIIDCMECKISNENIKLGLENDIYGIEIDQIQYQKCIENLNEIASAFNIYDVDWKIIHGDALITKFDFKFDYVIGNPPYIKYKDLDNETREYLKSNFETCSKGKFDYYYAFIESGIKQLTNGGKMLYIVPNNIFKNVFAEKVRNYMKPVIYRINDYKNMKVFQELTSSAVIYIQNSISEYIEYNDLSCEKVYNIEKRLLNKKWVFQDSTQISINDNKNMVRFGDYFTASMSIATLLNKAFIIKNYIDHPGSEYILLGEHSIEKDITRVAVSPRSLHYNKKERIIFPYYYENNKLQKIPEEQFRKKYPKATAYLNNYIYDLNKRDADLSAKWFEYGRSQAIAHMNQQKILMSTLITNIVKIYILNVDIIPYAGIYIVPNSNISLTQAKKILLKPAFYDYAKKIGINSNGVTLRITASDVNNYIFDIKELSNG